MASPTHLTLPLDNIGNGFLETGGQGLHGNIYIADLAAEANAHGDQANGHGEKPRDTAMGRIRASTEPTYAPAGNPIRKPARIIAGTIRKDGAICATLTMEVKAPVSPITLIKPRKMPTLNRRVRM